MRAARAAVSELMSACGVHHMLLQLLFQLAEADFCVLRLRLKPHRLVIVMKTVLLVLLCQLVCQNEGWLS